MLKVYNTVSTSIRKHFILRLTHKWEPRLSFQWIHLKQSKNEEEKKKRLKINLPKSWMGGQNRNERGQKETNNFKNKVMVQESHYTSDGQFRGN